MNNAGLRRSAVGAAVLVLSFTAAHSPAAAAAEQRFVAVPGTNVVLELWEGLDANGASAARYAISLDGRTFSEPRATSYDIKLRYGHFDPLGVSALPEVPANLASGEDTNIYIVQYVTQPLEVFRDALLDLGAQPRFFLANHCHIVRMDPDVVGQVESLPFVRWVGDFHPAYRLDPLVFDSIMNGETGWQDYSIMVFGAGRRPQNAVAEQLRALGGTVMTSSDDGFRMTVTATPDMIAQIARMDEVHFIDPWGPGEIDMDIVREIGGANYVEGETGYSGEGVRGEIFDTEVSTGHPEWLYPPIIHEPGNSGTHGSSCYGINFAQGVNPQARGLCPDGQGIFCWYESSDQFNGPRTRLEMNTEATDPAGPYRSCYQTSSVGSPRTTAYTSISADTDNYLFLVDYLSFQSQSNAGDPMSRPQAWAKNICSVGGITHENTLTRDDDHHTGGSTGPAADGRIKPDLAHFYDDIFTTTSGTGYTEFGGTSGATPCTSGHGGLTMQMWHEGVFPGFGGGPSVFDDRPKSTTTKALLINHAYRYVWYGTNPPNPDINRDKQGWGMADIGRMYDMRFKMFIVNETEVLTNLGSAYYTVDVIDDPSFRATMVYLDPPGSPSSSQARINDLSLKVTDPNGTVYWGNNGLHTSNVSSPGGVPNEVDTTECVFVDNPDPGTWIVEVIAHEIVEDAHLETPGMDADFALVVSGVTIAAPCPADVDGSGTVDVLDLLLVLAAWGATSGPEDINGDGIVDVLDLLELLGAWGPCPGPGACCFPVTGLCLDMFEQSCVGAGGVFQGVGTECATTNCPQPPMGACCDPLTGNCTDLIEYYCVQGGGNWQGAGTECATTNCPQPPMGACCLNYDCIATISQYECEDVGGTWYEGEDCATFQCPTPCPGSAITTLYASNNGGSLGGAIYFDVTVGPNPLTISGYETNTAELVAFTFEVYITDPGVSYSGNEANPAAWTLVATGNGTGMGEDNPSPVWLDNTFDLDADTLYGMALVMGPTAGHDYTNGDGTNQFYSNADLELECGSATNVPFSGSPFSPRVWNGTMCYFVGP